MLSGNAEAYEAQRYQDLAKQLRNIPVTMHVFERKSSQNDHSICFIDVEQFEYYCHILTPGERIFVQWSPSPPKLTAEERGPGVKQEKDDESGWAGVILDDNPLYPAASLTILLFRPTGDSPNATRDLPAVKDIDEWLPVQKVYIKAMPSYITVKARLDALDKQRWQHRRKSTWRKSVKFLPVAILLSRDTMTSSTFLLMNVYRRSQLP